MMSVSVRISHRLFEDTIEDTPLKESVFMNNMALAENIHGEYQQEVRFFQEFYNKYSLFLYNVDNLSGYTQEQKASICLTYLYNQEDISVKTFKNLLKVDGRILSDPLVRKYMDAARVDILKVIHEYGYRIKPMTYDIYEQNMYRRKLSSSSGKAQEIWENYQIVNRYMRSQNLPSSVRRNEDRPFSFETYDKSAIIPFTCF